MGSNPATPTSCRARFPAVQPEAELPLYVELQTSFANTAGTKRSRPGKRGLHGLTQRETPEIRVVISGMRAGGVVAPGTGVPTTNRLRRRRPQPSRVGSMGSVETPRLSGWLR